MYICIKKHICMYISTFDCINFIDSGLMHRNAVGDKTCTNSYWLRLTLENLWNLWQWRGVFGCIYVNICIHICMLSKYISIKYIYVSSVELFLKWLAYSIYYLWYMYIYWYWLITVIYVPIFYMFQNNIIVIEISLFFTLYNCNILFYKKLT